LEALPGLRETQRDGVKARAKRAWYWVNECAPEEFRFRVRQPGERAQLTETEIAAVKALRDEVVARLETFPDEKHIAEAIYAAAEKAGIDGKGLFRAAYQALIGKDQGPRLAGFLGTLGKDLVMSILARY
jgi:lysyl-tRNA synthetase class 1